MSGQIVGLSLAAGLLPLSNSGLWWLQFPNGFLMRPSHLPGRKRLRIPRPLPISLSHLRPRMESSFCSLPARIDPSSALHPLACWAPLIWRWRSAWRLFNLLGLPCEREASEVSALGRLMGLQGHRGAVKNAQGWVFGASFSKERKKVGYKRPHSTTLSSALSAFQIPKRPACITRSRLLS